jgi:hypothetical protein
MKPDLDRDRFWRYHHQVSPGLQEYIEALSFAHYLEHKTLITFEQVQNTLCDADAVPVRYSARTYCFRVNALGMPVFPAAGVRLFPWSV